ncbi:MAG: hypothetical protein AO394_03370 [Candidatus Fermentibacter daniensis]|nr:MAG: hypothetical protein AO394_03370 [Candidatus Fermentibacter daniensis]
MLAVGPPMSEIVPLNEPLDAILRTSASTDSSLRETMCFPWCSPRAQKLHPPAQPRTAVTESRIISQAGIGSR